MTRAGREKKHLHQYGNGKEVCLTFFHLSNRFEFHVVDYNLLFRKESQYFCKRGHLHFRMQRFLRFLSIIFFRVTVKLDPNQTALDFKRVKCRTCRIVSGLLPCLAVSCRAVWFGSSLSTILQKKICKPKCNSTPNMQTEVRLNSKYANRKYANWT